MIFDTLLTAQTAIIFIIAVVFTVVGWVMATKNNVKNTVESTIDNLIKDGYLKTQGTGKDMVILKWREWENDKTDRT